MARKKITSDFHAGDSVTPKADLLLQVHDASDDSIIPTANYAAIGSVNTPGTDGANFVASLAGSVVTLDGVDLGDPLPNSIKIRCKDEDSQESPLSDAFNTSLTPTYFVSNAGNDANDGLTELTAWATLSKVSNSNLIPGNIIGFKSGDTFLGRLIITSSGTSGYPITFSSYGVGAKPIIDGNDDYSSNFIWTLEGNSVYSTDTGYGASTCFNLSEDSIPLKKMNQYNDGVASDIIAPGQWAWNGTTDKIYVRTNNSVSPELANIAFSRYVATMNLGISGNLQDYLICDGLDIRGSYYSVDTWSSNTIVQNCEASNCYGDGLKVEGAHSADPDNPVPDWQLINVSLIDNNIYHFGETGIDNTGSKDCIIRGNRIHDAVATRGWYSVNGWYTSGILEKNFTINTIIEYNHIYDMNLLLSAIDIGGTSNGGMAIESTNCITRYNLIKNCTTIPDTNVWSKIIGITAAKNTQVYNNTITNCNIPINVKGSTLIYASSSVSGKPTYGTTNPIIKNNIFYNNINDDDNLFKEKLNGEVSGLIMNNNLYPPVSETSIPINLLTDQDSKFEDGTDGWNWSSIINATTTISTDAYEGNGALLIENTGGHAGRAQLVISGMTIGQKYTIKFWIKKNNNNPAWLMNDVSSDIVWLQFSYLPSNIYVQATETFTASVTDGIISVYTEFNAGTIGEKSLYDNIEIGIATISSGEESKFIYEGTTYDSVDSWKISGQESNSIQNDPLFVNPINDFNLQNGSLAINAAEDLGQTRDIDGNPIVGVPDIGTYENQS